MKIAGLHVREYVARVAARGVQPRPHQSIVNSILKAAVEAEVLPELPPKLPKLPKHSKRSPDAPSDDEV